MVCGRSEVFTLTGALSAPELKQYEAEAVAFVASPALRIQGDPKAGADNGLLNPNDGEIG